MAKIKLPPASESVEQICLFRWAAYSLAAMPELKLLHHIPNGGKRDITTAKRLKAEGVKAGVPDICLPVPKGLYHGLYVELKAGKNKTTENQDKWLGALTANGYYTAICYGWEAASKIIIEYLKLEDQPITKEQMQELKNVIVWVENFEMPHENQYCFVEEDAAFINGVEYFYYSKNDYNKTWRAYWKKPKGGRENV
jgi:hypothetical protein